jgi:hypothetical protein
MHDWNDFVPPTDWGDAYLDIDGDDNWHLYEPVTGPSEMEAQALRPQTDPEQGDDT